MGRCLHKSDCDVTCSWCQQPDLQHGLRDGLLTGLLAPRGSLFKAKTGLSSNVCTLEKAQTDIAWTIKAELSFPSVTFCQHDAWRQERQKKRESFCLLTFTAGGRNTVSKVMCKAFKAGGLLSFGVRSGFLAAAVALFVWVRGFCSCWVWLVRCFALFVCCYLSFGLFWSSGVVPGDIKTVSG